MKRIALLALLALPLAAFANQVDTTNFGGTLVGTTAGMTLSGSQLMAINGFHGGGLITGNLGSLTLSTGTLSGGSLQMGGTFNGGGTLSSLVLAPPAFRVARFSMAPSAER